MSDEELADRAHREAMRHLSESFRYRHLDRHGRRKRLAGGHVAWDYHWSRYLAAAACRMSAWRRVWARRREEAAS